MEVGYMSDPTKKSVKRALVKTIIYKKHLCVDCSFKTESKMKLKLHMVKHHGAKVEVTKYTCKICKFKSESQRELAIHHSQRHQKHFSDKCPYCDLVLSTNVLNAHIMSTHAAAGYIEPDDESKAIVITVCPYCGLLSSKEKLRQHITALHFAYPKLGFGDRLKCTLCKFYATNTETAHTTVIDHVVTVHDTQILKSRNTKSSFQCCFCDFQISNMVFLNAHIETNHKPGYVTTDSIGNFAESFDKESFNVKEADKSMQLEVQNKNTQTRTHSQPNIKEEEEEEEESEINLIEEEDNYLNHDGNTLLCPHCEFETSHEEIFKDHIVTFHDDLEPLEMDGIDPKEDNPEYVEIVNIKGK